MIKKIAIVVTQSTWGGAQRYTYDLATEYVKQGFVVDVIAGSSNNPILFNRLFQKNINFIEIPSLIRSINLLTDFRCVLNLLKLFKREKYDVIHLNSSKAGVVGSIAGKLSGCRCVIFTAHGYVFNERLSFLKKVFYIFAEFFSSIFKDAIITVSNYDRMAAIKYKIKSNNKLFKVWNGIDTDKNAYTSKEFSLKYLLGADSTGVNNKYIVGCIANFYENKGLKYVINGFCSSKQKVSNSILIIVGDGKLRKDLERHVLESKFPESIFLVGHKDDPEKYLKAFDVLLSGSLKEGLSYTLLEAGNAGIPIIATSVGGTPEIITNGENGILINPASSSDIGEALVYAYQNPDKMEIMSQKERVNVKANFDIQKMINQTLEVYEKVSKLSGQ